MRPGRLHADRGRVGEDEVGAGEVGDRDGRADRVPRVGFVASAANEATPGIIAAFARQRPGWRVQMRQAAWSNPSAGFATGDVDAAFVRLSFPGQEGLRLCALFSEPRLVALAAAHPLAAREEIAFPELRDEPFVATPAATVASPPVTSPTAAAAPAEPSSRQPPSTGPGRPA